MVKVVSFALLITRHLHHHNHHHHRDARLDSFLPSGPHLITYPVLVPAITPTTAAATTTPQPIATTTAAARLLPHPAHQSTVNGIIHGN
ncbi:hypothetical protein E2C01_032803 [Portunus trituberculatus]|uniref:Uncharacterized protein n=1 Tax=Portunus trituberculatus TaxID=210409 RepID=A0A5B7EYF0_PORTR|nr:hypothetical protein [Portunus trituberculatus]